MKTVHYYPNKSSFLSINKDMELIVKKILSNTNIKKMLFYPVKQCLQMPELNQEETLSLINNNIKIVPKIPIDSDLKTYIVITCDNFIENETNEEFRDNVICFDVICHYDTWNLGDFNLRPYRIVGELDAMFNNAHLTGIGELQFLGANQLIINDEFGGISLMYQTIHGEEDKIV